MAVRPRWLRLPVVETLVYLACGMASILVICYHVFVASSKYFHLLNKEDFDPGWTLLPYKKDVSNYEWTFWYDYFWRILPWYLGNIILGRFLEVLQRASLRRNVMLVYALLTLTVLLGVKTVLFYTAHVTIAFLASLSKSKSFVWITCLALLTTLNMDYFNHHLMIHVYSDSRNNTGDNYYLFIFCLALVNLRYISFCLEKCESSGISGSYGFLDIMHYVFYLPLFFTGPLLSYDRFMDQFCKSPPSWSAARIRETLKDFSRVLFWGFFNEFITHIVYFDAIHRNVELLNLISMWALVGIAYCQGQFFMTKYVVLYGIPSGLANLDGLSPPQGPKCVSYVYRYSHMWKCFDRGFYYFLKRYIYIPFGGSQHGVFWQLFGSFTCFMFIYVWHGAEVYLFLWCLLNYVGCTIEVLGAWFVQTNTARNYLNKLGSDNIRRLDGLVSVPLYLMSAMGIFVFFGGYSVGKIFFNRLLVDITWPAFVLFIFLLYCNIQNAIFIQDWQNRNKRKEA